MDMVSSADNLHNPETQHSQHCDGPQPSLYAVGRNNVMLPSPETLVAVVLECRAKTQAACQEQSRDHLLVLQIGNGDGTFCGDRRRQRGLHACKVRGTCLVRGKTSPGSACICKRSHDAIGWKEKILK